MPLWELENYVRSNPHRISEQELRDEMDAFSDLFSRAASDDVLKHAFYCTVTMERASVRQLFSHLQMVRKGILRMKGDPSFCSATKPADTVIPEPT